MRAEAENIPEAKELPAGRGALIGRILLMCRDLPAGRAALQPAQ